MSIVVTTRPLAGGSADAIQGPIGPTRPGTGIDREGGGRQGTALPSKNARFTGKNRSTAEFCKRLF